MPTSLYNGMKSFLTISMLFIFGFSYSQKEDYIWLGGYDFDNDINDTTRVEGYRMDFNKKPFGVENDISWQFGILGNNASICDKEGKLLFFTNGCAVFNKNYHIMPNGDSINSGEWFDKLWKSCGFGYPGTQDILIIPDPGNDKGYYLLHKTNIYNPGPGGTYLNLNYSYIDISLENGKGDVTIKNNTFDTNSLLSQYLSALKHENKKDWWLIQPIINDSTYLTYLIDESGINKKPNQNTHQYFDRSRSSASGTAKFSPDGTKYAIYNYYDQLHVYNFDRATGLLSNHKKIEIYPPSEIDRTQIKIGSVEWSPNGRFIYCASWDNLHQVDMWANDPQDAVRLIDTYNGTLDPFETNFALLVQGPDCRIYLSPRGGQYSIHVINKPNELGTACDFIQNGIKFLYPNGGTLPNFPRFRVDEEEKCDPTITSVFGEKVYYRRDLEVYPNPSSGLFKIKLPELIGDANMVVSNINGQIVYKKEIRNSIIEEIDITNQAAGRYNIEVYPLENNDRIFWGRQVIKI